MDSRERQGRTIALTGFTFFVNFKMQSVVMPGITQVKNPHPLIEKQDHKGTWKPMMLGFVYVPRD